MISIEQELMKLGVAPSLTGFDYLCDLLNFTLTHKKDDYTVKQVYGLIAEKRKVSVQAVERMVRHAIHSAFKVGNEYLSSRFGSFMSKDSKTVTNKVFISVITTYLTLEQKPTVSQNKGV